MVSIKTIVLTEAIKERRGDVRNAEGKPRQIVDISSINAVEVTINIHEDYSADKVKEALTKIFEKAIECF